MSLMSQKLRRRPTAGAAAMPPTTDTKAEEWRGRDEPKATFSHCGKQPPNSYCSIAIIRTLIALEQDKSTA
jgi:hypothetical protein